jgi:hypothetical protein
MNVGRAMSLRQSPTLTPALLASNRSNAKKCTVTTRRLRRENEKEFFFHTFKAGMLLKTNKSEMMGAFK